MMRENQRLLNQLHVFTDGLAVFLAMLVSYWLRFSLFRGVRGMPLNYYIWLGVVAAALTLAVFAVAGLYESFRTVRFHVEASRVAALELLVSLIVMAAIYVLRLGETSRWTVVFFYAVSTLLLTGKRAAMRLLLRRCRAMGYNQKRVLLVGHGEGAEAYLTRVAMDKNLGFRVIGYVAERGCWDALPYCGSYEELDAIFASEKPDEVVVALPTEEGRWMGRIINACEKDGTKLSVVPSYVRYMPANPQFDSVNGLPLINLLMSGGMAQDKAYFTAAIIFTVPGLLFAVLLYRNSREVVEPQKSTKLPAKDLWHFVIQNGPLLMVMFGQFVCGIYMYGRSGVMMYYFTYYAGNTNLFTIYNLIAIGCGIAGPFTAPILMEKCGNKGRIVALGAIGSGALFVAMNFINAGTNPLLFYIFAGVSGYFNGLIMAAVYACMLDTIEVGQYKTGIRASAFAVSLCHFANKLGMTISTAGVGAVLAALGFAANQTQNGDVLFWINGFFTWVPGVIGIVVGVVFLFYKLNRERYYEILAKLKEKAE